MCSGVSSAASLLVSGRRCCAFVRPVEEKPDERLPLVISRTLAGYSDEVIARELGVNVRTVYRIRAKARAA